MHRWFVGKLLFVENVVGQPWLEQLHCKLFTGCFDFYFVTPVNINFFCFSWQTTLENIRLQLEKAQSYQTYLTKKNFKSHFIVTRSGSRVFWWSLIQSIALIGVAICQVLIVKNFFGTNSTGQKIWTVLYWSFKLNLFYCSFSCNSILLKFFSVLCQFRQE